MKGVWWWEGDDIPIATLSPPELLLKGEMRATLIVSLIVRDKGTRQCPQTTTLLKRKESRSGIDRGPSAYQPNTLPLGQTG